MEKEKLLLWAESMTVLGDIEKTEVFQLVYRAVESLGENLMAFCKSYSALCQYIYEHGCLPELFYQEILYNQNIFAKMTKNMEETEIPSYIMEAAEFDLAGIHALSALSAMDLLNTAAKIFHGQKDFILRMPHFPMGGSMPVKDAKMLYAFYKEYGFGYFARGKAFYVENGKPLLVQMPDETRLSDLKGYERQKEAIIRNTLSFLDGQEANNILLYGDKGTGKSSTVKAVINEYADRGLKIIEMQMNQITFFPQICDAVKDSPFYFIIFLDDLSFHKEDENFTALKAFIEGGIGGKPANLLIYATSNRRHLVRESFQDRAGDEIHLRDTLETITSLSDRFGLEITFSVPEKDEYLYIVDMLAEEVGLFIEQDTLHQLAEQFALRRNGRSPRTARQFIQHQISVENQKAE